MQTSNRGRGKLIANHWRGEYRANPKVKALGKQNPLGLTRETTETIYKILSYRLRRGDRVADCAALEMLCCGNATAGSNPALSATFEWPE